MELREQFTCRAPGDAQELPKLARIDPASPFRDVARHRDSTSAHLRGQAIQLRFRERSGQLIDRHGQFDRLLPHFQFTVILGHALPFGLTTSYWLPATSYRLIFRRMQPSRSGAKLEIIVLAVGRF